MKKIIRLATVAGLAFTTTAFAATSAQAATSAPAATTAHPATSHRGGAVFVQSDDPAGNTVVAFRRAGDGTLTSAGSYATGGLGGVLTGSVADHLASQGSLLQDDGLLYAVNAGSDTITTFGVHGDQLARRQVLPSGGTFPVSVTASGRAVYVLNARDGGSVQGYLRAGDRLIQIPSWHRDLGLDPASTPEFTHTAGQIGFTPDGSQLVVTTKAGGQSIDVFGVRPSGGLAPAPVVNPDPGNVPFGFTFDARGRLVVSEAGPNAVATFAITKAGTVNLISRVATGQAATCWVIRSGSTLFASNAGSGSISALHVSHDGSLQALGNTATDKGTVDAAATADGRYLYVQAGVAGQVDEFAVAADSTLTPIGSVTVPGAAGGQGIVAS